jgi:hypothetical protein
MTNKKPWEYQEEEIRHETTGAIGAKTPQGDVVYGPLAKNYLTPIENVPKINIPEKEAPKTAPGETLMDKTPTDWLLQQQKEARERIAEQQAELEKAQEERKGLIKQTKDFFSGVPKAEDKVRELQKEFGTIQALELQDKAIDEIMKIRNQVNLLKEQRDGSLAAIEQQGTLTPFMTRQQATIAENYDRRINSLAAQESVQIAMLQAQQGRVEQARALTGDIVNAMTYDTQLELDKMKMFLDINADEINMLDTSIQRDLTETKRQMENQLKEEKEEKTAVLEMMISYNKAGISPNDTLEEAATKAQEWSGIQPDAKVEELMAKYPKAGITEEDSFAEAITKIAKMPKEELTAETVGGFNVLRDASGNVISVNKVEKEGYAPSSYEKEWITAGGIQGTGKTLGEWVSARVGIELPVEWTEDEIKAAANQSIQAGEDLQTVLDKISLNSSIKNKDKAIELAIEAYSGLEEETYSPFWEGKLFEIDKDKLEKQSGISIGKQKQPEIRIGEMKKEENRIGIGKQNEPQIRINNLFE